MGGNPPVVYLLHGEDEVAITQFVDAIVDKLGDSAMAEVNTARLDGRSISLEELETATRTLPFLVKRRLVIVTNPTTRCTTPAMRKRFLTIMENVPQSVAVILVEDHILTNDRDRRNKKVHWLERWAQEAGDRVLLRPFPQPKGGAMVNRIREIAKQAGGEISIPAAKLLASLVGDNVRTAANEIQKLLAYVNYHRPVEPDDVELLTGDYGQGDIFAMVDAIGNQNGRLALDMLNRLMGEQEPLAVFGMVIRQFRLLLLSREILDAGGGENDIIRELNLHPFVAKKLIPQAQRFRLPDLEAIYKRLLDIDEALKTGGIEGELALDTLIAATTQS